MLATLTTVLSLLGALTVSAAPLQERAGPSGSVIIPAEGTIIQSYGAYPTGKFQFQYQTVLETKESDCGGYGCSAQTWNVQVDLVSETTNTTLVQYLAPEQQGGIIDAWLVAPANVCGDVRLVITEFQNYYEEQISFQSAAPAITINCQPIS